MRPNKRPVDAGIPVAVPVTPPVSNGTQHQDTQSGTASPVLPGPQPMGPPSGTTSPVLPGPQLMGPPSGTIPSQIPIPAIPHPTNPSASPHSRDQEAWDRSKPTIALRGVSKIYRGVLGINNITLDIFPGITGFLGPNGAGKSTVLKVIAGLLHPSSGTVRIFGRNPRRDSQVLSRVGYCPEHDAFYPDMTGKEFVAHFLRIRGEEREKAFRMADLILTRLDLQDKMDRRLGGYSRGMKQKVKVATAVVHNPDLLILDEPLQGADPESRHLLIRNMKAWAKAGMTILVSSHVLKEIERMTRRVVLINEGRVYAVGEMDQIRAMMVNRPITVRIWLQRPEEMRSLASLLVREPSVSSVRIEGLNLIVHTLDAREFYAVAPRILADNSFAINEFMPVDDDLESLYYFLMSQRRW